MSDYRFLDPRRVIQGFQPAVLEKIIKYQAKRVKALKQQADRTGKPVRAPHVCIILDDVVGGAESVSRSGPLNWLYASGRHLAMSCILCTQSATVCSSPLIKTNSTLCLCGPLSPLQTRALWESTSGLTASFKEFMQSVGAACDRRVWVRHVRQPRKQHGRTNPPDPRLARLGARVPHLSFT